MNRANTNRRTNRKSKHAQLHGQVPSIETIDPNKLSHAVINLSTKIQEVTPHQLFLFYLGKSFAPTPALPDYSKFRLNILQFAYKLRWAWFWHTQPQPKATPQTIAAIKSMERTLIKSDETKPLKVCNNHCLELYIERVTKDLLQTNSSTRSKLPDNIPVESRKALSDMAKWKDIVIRPADKGSQYFFLDREDYIKRVKEHLDAETFDTVQKEEAEHATKLAIIDWIAKYHEEPGLTEKVYQWVTPDDFCKPGNNYVNPKAHKPEKNYPGRMISTGCASAIKNLSALTAYELTKVDLKYAIQDNNHILRKLDDLNNSKSLEGKTVIHASFDIEAMFPSIQKEVGLEQCRLHLDKREDPILSTDCIIDALETTLDNNITEFEGVIYKQKKGTAMGPKNACAYADTAIDKIDRDVMEGTWSHPPLLWARYRDDVYVPWTHGQEMLEEFHLWLNSRMPGIKFTLKASLEGTEFLDTFIYMKAGQLHTKPYSKPCDDHAFLVPTSCHPTHTIKNIPYSTALRIFKLTSEHDEYIQARAQYTSYLVARGYSNSLINQAFDKVETKSRLSYYQQQRHKEDDSSKGRLIPLVTDFNPGLPNIGRILNSHKHILRLDLELCKVIDPDGIFTSFRGTKTLHEILIHSKLPPVEEPAVEDPGHASPDTAEDSDSGGCFPCAKKCDLCKNFLKPSTTIGSFHTNQVFSIKGRLDCDTKNVVYIVNDNICKLSYIGCTSDSLKVRFRNHKSHIKTQRRTCELSCHFIDNEILHNLDRTTTKLFTSTLSKDINVSIIEQVDVGNFEQCAQDRLSICKQRENFWQNQLKTLKHFGGMNVREER